MSNTASRAGIGLTATVAGVSATSTAIAGIWIGIVGFVVAVSGARWRSRRLLGAGVGVLFVAIVVAAVLGTSAWVLVSAMAGALLAWDIGENSISVAEQLTDDADTRRGETLHAVVSTAVVALFATLVFAVYQISFGDYPLIAVALLAVGALVVLFSLGR